MNDFNIRGDPRKLEYLRHFELWAEDCGISEGTEVWLLCKEAWNLAVDLSSDIVGMNEGIDFGIIDELYVE